MVFWRKFPPCLFCFCKWHRSCVYEVLLLLMNSIWSCNFHSTYLVFSVITVSDNPNVAQYCNITFVMCLNFILFIFYDFFFQCLENCTADKKDSTKLADGKNLHKGIHIQNHYKQWSFFSTFSHWPFSSWNLLLQ